MDDDWVFVSWDGTRHDSLQHTWFIEHVDNYILRRLVPIVCAIVGFTVSQIDAILANLTALQTPVELLVKDKRFGRRSKYNKILSGQVNGTVFSGHPSRTTWGNTTRIIMFVEKVVLGMSIIRYLLEFFHFQAGDDSLIVMRKSHVKDFETVIKDAYRGYGLRMQDFKVGKTGEFLSRWVIEENEQVYLLRFCDRVVQTGLYSTKVDQSDMKSFDKGITDQLSAWGSDTVGVSAFCKWRSATDATRMSKRVEEVMKDRWSNLTKESACMAGLINVEPNYLRLDGSLGNPYALWVEAA